MRTVRRPQVVVEPPEEEREEGEVQQQSLGGAKEVVP